MTMKEAFDLAIKLALQQASTTSIAYYILYPIMSGDGFTVPYVRADYLIDAEREDILLTVLPGGTIKFGEMS